MAFLPIFTEYILEILFSRLFVLLNKWLVKKQA